MNLFITLLENVNKSRTSANNVSLRLASFNTQNSPSKAHHALVSGVTVVYFYILIIEAAYILDLKPQ
jgi:hypothetical protein